MRNLHEQLLERRPIYNGKTIQMESAFERAEELVQSLKEYANNRIEYIKLSGIEKGSKIIAAAVAAIIVAVMILFFLIFASIALSVFLSEFIGISWVGFLIVACIYLVIALIVWATKRTLIQRKIMNAIIKQLFDGYEQQN